MDISFKTEQGRFNYRVSAVILRDGCLLTMKDNLYSYSYLPGGRVKMGETTHQAMLREIREELRAELRILRPLWFCEDFFVEEDTQERFHELCVYYLVDGSGLPEGDFAYTEGERINRFSWTKIEDVKMLRLYPAFLRKRIENLPEQLEMIIERK